MATIEQRLQALEAAHRINAGRFMGLLELEAGQRPIDALEGAKPGLWFITDASLNAGFMGRVSQSGKRTIVFGGDDHVNH